MSNWSYTRVGAKDGKGIQSITEYYKLSANTTETFSASTILTWSTSVSQPTSAKPYLLNAELVVYSDGTKEYKAPHVASRYITDGQAGRGIAGITEYYLATSAFSGVTRSTSGWTKTIQTMTSTKKYLWNYEETTYTDDSDPSYTNPCIIGVYGDNGDKGDTGAKALQPKKNFTSTYTTVGGIASWEVSNFNRTPVEGDTFANLDGSSNTGTWEITAISGNNATFKLLSYVNSKGATGAKGDTGSKGDKGDTGTRGSVWYSGTGITGTSTTATVFSGSGVSSALVGDMYKNTSTNYTYRCTVAGNASTAKWVYTGNLTGAKGDKGDKGNTGGTGSRAPKYRGPGSAPTTDLIVGDWYLNTSDGKVYVRAASSWTAQSTTVPNQYHLACINDMVSLLGTTTSATVKSNLETICNAYVERLLVGTAFINKLSANQITFTEYVGSGKLSGWLLNDINVALGKNPFNSSDTDLSFIIQSYKRANSSSQNPIFNKEFYLKKENNRFNLVTSGKILSDMGISSFNNCYLGGKLIRHTISGQAQNLNGWNAACVYYKNYFFIFWGKSGSGIIVQRSSDCTSFSTYTTLSSYTYLVYDAVVYKDYIYLATSNGVYKTNSATPTSLTLVTSTYKPYRLQIINDILFFPHNTMFVYYDGSTLSTYSTSAKSNYISEFTDGIYFVSPTAEVASGQASASVIDVYFYNKNFDYLGAYECLTKYYDSSGNKVSYSSIGVIGAAKGILYGYVDFNKIVLSYDAGVNWYQKFSFTLQGTPRLFISGSLVVIKDETHYCYSFDGGETWAEVTGGSGSTYLPGNCFTFEDDNDFYVGIPYCKSGTALGIDFIRQHKVGTTSYLPISAPKIIENGAVWIE